MFETIFEEAAASELSIGFTSAVVCILASLVMGIATSVIYYISGTKRNRSSSFILSLIVLPAIVAIVIVLIGENVARAFSLAGIFTLVRFRSIPGDSKDITFVFLAMAEGLCNGLGYITLGAAVTVILGIVIIAVSKIGFGMQKKTVKRLTITIPEDMNFQDAFDDLFEKFTLHHELGRIKTTNMGTLFELQYSVIMKKNVSEKEFIDLIRCRNGNLSIQLGLEDYNQQL